MSRGRSFAQADPASHHVDLSSELAGFIGIAASKRTSGQPLLERTPARGRLERLLKWIYDRGVAHLYERA